jgi:cobalt-zinc-cadmium efflux system outer membrane protein
MCIPPRLLLVLAVLVLISGVLAPLFSQEKAPASALDSLIQKALTNNPDIRSQRAKILAAEERVPQAKALPNPRLDLELMDLSVSHPSLSDALTKNISLAFYQELPGPGKRKLATDEARSEADLERAKLHQVEARLRGDIKAAVYRLWMYRRQLEVNGRLASALSEAAKNAAAAYSTGSGSQSDVLVAQSLATRALVEREELEHQSDEVLVRLQSLMGGSLNQDAVENISVPAPGHLPSLDALEATVKTQAPDILKARAESILSERNVSLAKKASEPDFMVGTRYRRRDTTMGGGDFLTLNIGVTLPFFHRKDRYQPLLQESLYARESARDAEESAVNLDLYKLSEAYHSALMAVRVYGLYKEGLLIQARQAYESALSSYSVGKVDFTTLSNSLTSLYEYESQALTAQADYWVACTQMESVAGGALPLAGPGAEPGHLME